MPAKKQLCGNKLRRTAITHEVRRGVKIHLFDNVPAQVCSACGEVWIEETTLEQIDHLIQAGRPTRKVETPVYDLAAPPAA